MTTATRLLKNSLVLSLTAGLERGMAFVLPLYIARSLGASTLGVYTLIISWWLIFESLAYLGLDQLVIRNVARNPDQALSIMLQASLVGAVSSAAAGTVMASVAYGLGYPPDVAHNIYIIAGFVLVFDTLSTVAESVIKGLERMEYVLLVRFPGNLVRVVVSIVALAKGVSLSVVFWMLGAFQVLMLVAFVLLIVRWRAGERLRVSWPLCRELARAAMVFLGINAFAVAFRNADVILLSHLRDRQTVGLYGAADKIVQMVQIMSPAIMVALFPSLSQAFVASREKLARLVSQSLKLLTVGLLPLAFVIWALADRIIALVYGADEYAMAVNLLRTLAWMLPPYFASNLLFRTMIASNNERITFRVAAWNAAVNLGLNLALIPVLGAMGSCIAAVATACVAFTQNYYHINRRVIRLPLGRLLGYPLASLAAAMGVYGLLVRVHPLLALAGALLLYGGLLILTKTLSRAEWRYVEQSWYSLVARLGMRA